jgi:Mn2+/Fe2+ NRAMP family transporter
MAVQLKPLLGRWAKCLFAVGLLAAGFSSAITAPLAAAYATCGVLGWDRSQHAGFFAVVWGFVLAVGTAFGVMGVKPVEAIIFAQAANGLLLPLVALFLLAAVNNRKLLGRYANGGWANVLGAIVFLTVLTLSLFQIVSAIAKLGRPSP